MDKDLSNAILKLGKRAEKYTTQELISTFVEVGSLFTLLSSSDHQILYGRRGTGKTHILNYLANDITSKNNCVINIDLRTIGSTGGLYSDDGISIAERATRLLVDTLSVIHDEILNFIINANKYDLSRLGPILDDLGEAIKEVRILGPIEKEQVSETGQKDNDNFGFNLSPTSLALNIANDISKNTKSKHRKLISGVELHRVHFPSLQQCFRKLIENLNGADIWIILDEWSEIPLELQPFLGDLLRRTLFPIRGVTVKIGVIEHRSNFRYSKSPSDYIGFEIGADVTSLNLDECMVFDNNEYSSIDFFKKLIFKHVNADLPPEKKMKFPDDFVNNTFTQTSVFEEFVRSTEGVPRDAINILVIAVLKASTSPKISIKDIREAAKIWYNRDKEKSIASNPKALELLRWIIDEVIGNRSARAFLIRTDVKDDLIDYLYDARIIHLIKESISGKDQPGIRYNVYSIDYGCYVDLINTSKAPKGLFMAETDSGEEFVNVPVNDYRAIRRAILNLEEFYNKKSGLPS